MDTGEGHPIAYKVNVDCETAIEGQHGSFIVPFHEFKFHQHCAQTTTTTVAPKENPVHDGLLDDAPPCVLDDNFGNRKVRSNDSHSPGSQLLCQEPYLQPDGKATQVEVEDKPDALSVKSSADTLGKEEWLSFLLLTALMVTV